jgi:IclR family pca regulon transcriptional regulator
MGRVLLAGLDEGRLDEYLGRVRLVALTPHTITDKDKLRAAVAQVRDQGWSLVDQELELGVRSVAAPLRDRAGATVAAINISAHAGRVSAADLRRHMLPLVRATADEISGLFMHR